MPYNEENRSISWAESSLCNWLNYQFLILYFTKQEREHIVRRRVKAEKNPFLDAPAGNDIPEDNRNSRIFLLNIQEVLYYFAAPGYENGDVRDIYWTDLGGLQAVAQTVGTTSRSSGNKIQKDLEHVSWWLRSPGDRDNIAATVFSDGSILHGGDFVDSKDIWVRPAFYYKL